MNDIELEQIRTEIESAFAGLRFGRVFPLSRHSMAVGFYPPNGAYLFIDCDPRVRQIYLIRRRLKDLERASTHATPFVIQLRRLLSGRKLLSVEKNPNERVLFLDLAPADADGAGENLDLVIQLGGKVANILVMNNDGIIVEALRKATESGQSAGEKYAAPIVAAPSENAVRELKGRSLSELLDEEGRTSDAARDFDALANAARKKINGEIARRQKLIKNLEGDLAGHGDPDEWKRYGDLILANISNIRRDDDKFIVIDYFDPDQSEIAIAVDRNDSPTEAAEEFFRRYAKARNGRTAIAKRLETVKSEIASLQTRKTALDAAIATGDEQSLSDFLPAKKAEVRQSKRKEKSDEFKGARRFRSSDGFEIMVGKKAKDNDFLTFRLAKSLDLWLHAADYPGSHVVVRNPNRKDIPNQTLLEAAELAAFYSDARSQPKAAVNYTQKKFVNKPKRAAPGLVSLASFKTILVEPKVGVEATALGLKL